MINKISFILFSLLFFSGINLINAQNLNSLPLSDLSYNVVFNANNTNIIKIVALGEFTHGGAEVFSFKSSISKFLIENKKFRTIFFEYDDPSLRELNAFVQNGKIDNEKLVSIFKKAAADTPLGCTEIYELITWIKDYNLKNPEDMVSIRGMDIVLDISYFQKEYIDPVYYNKLIADHKGKLLDIPAQYQILKSWYESEHKNIFKNFDQQKLEQLRRDLENFHSNSVFMTGGDVRSAKMNGYRDSIMSVNVMDLMKGNSIIWAHNSHVIKSGLQYNLFKAKSLGSYLYSRIGDGYYCILTDFSAVANVTAQIGERFKSKKHYPNKLSLSYRLLKNYQFGQGMVNAPALKALKLNDYNMNTISLEGRKVLLNGNSNSSDLFVFFSTVSPSHLLF